MALNTAIPTYLPTRVRFSQFPTRLKIKNLLFLSLFCFVFVLSIIESRRTTARQLSYVLKSNQGIVGDVTIVGETVSELMRRPTLVEWIVRVRKFYFLWN